MSKSFKLSVTLLIILGLAWIAYLPLLFRPDKPSKWEQQTKPAPALSVLAAPPDWASLEIYQNTITREEFERLLTTVFTSGDAWRSCIEINETEARIKTGTAPTDPLFHLRFALAGQPAISTPRPKPQ